MMLTGQEIFEQNIVTNASVKNIQQQGVDLVVRSIAKMTEEGQISKSRTFPAACETVEPSNGWYHLQPGVYDIRFEEGCNIPAGVAARILARSSVLRCGGIIVSGLYDAGFKTEHCGCFLTVNNPMYIEVGSRLAQFICLESHTVATDKLYNGQYQNT